jgi:hypothetical protein
MIEVLIILAMIVIPLALVLSIKINKESGSMEPLDCLLKTTPTWTQTETTIVYRRKPKSKCRTIPYGAYGTDIRGKAKYR